MKNYFWLSKGEKYKDVHIRYLAEHNRIDEFVKGAMEEGGG